MRRFLNHLHSVLVVSLVMSTIVPPSAHAVSRNVKSVITAAEYGVLGGLGLGLIALPLTREGKSVFMGVSIGLYLGILAGFYHIEHRDDPGNPLRRAGLDGNEFVMKSRKTPIDEPVAVWQAGFTVHRF